MNKIERVKELVELLNKASNAYYNTDRPIISDVEFDKLFNELQKLEQETNYISSVSPTINVGYEVKTKLNKISHSIPLKSLGKTKNLNEIDKFIGDKEVLIMLKGDGLTSEIIYNNGNLNQGSTRGNSIIGEDITHNVKTYKNIPLKINFKGYLKLAGESVIFTNDFELINNKLSEENKYSNSRNLVAGSVRQLDSGICAKRNVNFMAFTLLECYDKMKNKIEFETLENQFNFLGDLGFYIIPYIKYKKNKYDNEDTLAGHIDSLKKYAIEKGIPIDGHVIKYNNLAYGSSLGETAHHPLNAIALKASNDEYETEYIKTEWQVSRTGLINPVGTFKPVNIDGADITRATLHNIDYFKTLRLGKNDKINVIRANQVIPKIVGNNTKSNTEVIPDKCPVCGTKTKIKLLKTANVLYCTNEDCPSRRIAQFSHFVSRDAMNIIGLSDKSLEKFINLEFLKDLSDIYKLEQYKNQIVNLEGFGEKSYKKLIESINKSKQCSLYQFIFSLGMPNVGLSTSKDLVKFLAGNNSDEKLLNLNYLTVDKLLEMKDCGEITAKSIINWINDQDNKDMANEILNYITFKEEKKVETNEVKDNPIKGKKLYCTGTFASYKKKELKDIVEKLGGIFANGYAKSLDMLVVGSIKGSSKEEKARVDGVKIITEDQFNEMLGRIV